MKIEPKRDFNRMLFLGNGEQSAKRARLLKKKLNTSIMLLSGLQQAGDSDKESLAYIDKTIQDIVVALTGREIRSLHKKVRT